MSDDTRLSRRLALLVDDALGRWPEQLRRDIEHKVIVLEEFRKGCLRIEDTEAADLADAAIRAAIKDWKALDAIHDPARLLALFMAEVGEGGHE